MKRTQINPASRTRPLITGLCYRRWRCHLHFGLLLGALVALSCMTRAQDADVSERRDCLQKEVVTIPSRPSFSNGAATTQCGVAEVEYGWNYQWPGGGTHQDSLSGGLRFGITPKLDFHYSSDSFLDVYDGKESERGFGDSWLGLKYRFFERPSRGLALSILYMAKIPSASEEDALGTGEVDHSISLLASKDVSRLHFDFNAIEYLGGRDSGPRLDHCTQFALSASAPLHGPWGAIVEGYGSTELNSDVPSFASGMLGLTYQVNRRLVFDGGLDLGLTHGSPNKRAYVGVTYAITNLYAWLARER